MSTYFWSDLLPNLNGGTILGGSYQNAVCDDTETCAVALSGPGHRKRCHNRDHAPPSLPRINSHLTQATVYKLKSAAMTLFQCLASRGLWSETQADEVFFPSLTCPEQSRGRRLRDRMLPLPSKTTQTVPAEPQQPPPRSTDSFRGKVHPPRGTVTTFAFFSTHRNKTSTTINNFQAVSQSAESVEYDVLIPRCEQLHVKTSSKTTKLTVRSAK